jgi:serine/threonine protein kinase
MSIRDQQLIDERLDDFEVKELIGHGAMASVYRAFDLSLERDVALKIPDFKYADNPVFKERFNSEARAMAKLQHNHIVQIFSAGEYDGIPYMAMEFVDGMPLSRILADREGMEPDEAAEYVLQVCEAIECAHQAGVIHRDLKPGNIMVEPSGRVLVADFGIAKIMSGDTEEDTLTFVGTPTYMSPEQCGEGTLDKRTDIYSLGVIFYEMVMGKPPFTGNNPAEIIKCHLMETPSFVGERRKNLPPALVKIIRKCLAKDPEQRFADAHALMLEVKEWRKKYLETPRAPVEDMAVSRDAPVIACYIPQKIMLGAVLSGLRSIEHHMIIASSASELLSNLSALPVKAIVLSHKPGTNAAFKLAEKIKESRRSPNAQLVLLSPGISRREVETAFLSGINDIVAEPFDPSVLISKIESALIGAHKTVESRRFFRTIYNDTVMVKVESEILDISEGGMRLATNLPLKIGQLLTFETQLFKDLELGEKSGKVVWISKDETAGFTLQAGIAFLDLSTAERDRLRKWIFSNEVESKASDNSFEEETHPGPPQDNSPA